MAEFCLDCFNKLIATRHFTENEVYLSKRPYLCEGCGEVLPVVLQEKNYVSPQLNVEEIQKADVVTSSVENFKSHVAEPGDWGDDPIIDEDDDIIW